MPELPRFLPLNKNAALDHERLTSLINSMADGVIAIDAHQRIIVYNGAALNILDLNSSMTGKQLSRILHLVDNEGEHVNVHTLIEEAKQPVSNRDYRIAYRDESFANLYISIAPVHLGYGQRGMKGHVVLLRDITHEKSLEEERDEFISVVSHELRTPIAIAEGNISNALYVLEKSGNTADAKSALQQAHDQTMFLSGMINDLSTLSRAQRGKLNVSIDTINVHNLMHDLGKNYETEASKKDLKLTVQTDPELELLHSSELYVREILQNFITNAIKYTEKGHVSIAAKPSDNGVQFMIEDSGIGISKTDQLKVFDKFFRSEDFRTRRHNGTGLGLYVTMKLARIIHAQVALESELNHGSTFTITVPNLE